MDAKPARPAPLQAPEGAPAAAQSGSVAPERFGELELRRLEKPDGRALIVYRHVPETR
ncbi:MAG: hypothetical protein ACLQBB_05540 [Solirubrobacteraceae bacterium]